MREYTVRTWYLALVLMMCKSVSKFVTARELSYPSRMTNWHGQWVCWMSMGGESRLVKHTQQCR